MNDLGGNASVMAAHWGSVTQKLRALHVPGAGHLTASVSALTSHRKALLFALNFLLAASALYFFVYLKEPVYGAFICLLGATLINRRWLGRLTL